MDETLTTDLAAFTAWLARDQQLDPKTVRTYRRAVVSCAAWPWFGLRMMASDSKRV
jgi:hypothetical protein